jgi:hypothetical protein
MDSASPLDEAGMLVREWEHGMHLADEDGQGLFARAAAFSACISACVACIAVMPALSMTLAAEGVRGWGI